MNVNYGANQKFTITPNTGYHVDSVIVNGVKVDSTTSYTFNNVTTNHTIRVVFAANILTITFNTNPAGLSFKVDGITYSTPQIFNWTAGSSHVITSDSMQSVVTGTRYIWNSWTNATKLTDTIAPLINTTYTANFTTQYLLTMIANPGGTATPPSGWYNGGQEVLITAIPNTNFSFNVWSGSGSGSYSGYINPSSVIMNGPITQVASFRQNDVNVTVQTVPSGRTFWFNYSLYTLPQTFPVAPGTIRYLGVDSPQPGASGVQYVWNRWSDSGDMYHNIQPFSDTTYTVYFTRQHYLTMIAGSGGTVTPASGWRDSNQIVLIKALPNQGYIFKGWTGTGTGSYSGLLDSVYISMNSPITQTASFAPDTMIITASAGVNGTITPSGNVKVVYNTNQSFIITPDLTYNISDVVVDGISVGAVSSYTFNNVRLNHSIIASFTRTGYTITATSGPNGTITPSGPISVEHGLSQQFTIAPNIGYHIDSVLVNGVRVDSTTSYTFNNVTANNTIRAVFAINQFTINSSSGANGTITPLGAVNVNYGANQKFTITPNIGYHVDSVIVDGVKVDSTTSYTFNNVTANHTIRTVFAINQFTITSSAGLNGTISPLGIINVNYGANQQFTITPNTAYHVDSIIVNGVKVDSTTSYTFNNVTASHTIRAVFAINQFTITSSAGTNGSILPSGVVNVNYGANQKFTITPNTGYHVDSVIVNGVKVDSTTSYTFINVTANHTIRAVFAINQFTITSSAGTNGSILPSGVVNVNYGANQKFTITPNTGYHVDSIIVNGVKVDSTTSYTFNNVTTSHTIRAVFAINILTITFNTNPTGLLFKVDGITYSTPQIFNWTAGSSHVITSDSMQSGVTGTRYLWNSWTNATKLTDTIAPLVNTTYTANFTTQYYLTMIANSGGTVTPPSGWYNRNQKVTITATPDQQFRFVSWSGFGSGSGAYSGTNNPAEVTMDSPISETANFARQPIQIVVQANPPGRYFLYNGVSYNTMQTRTINPGDVQYLGAVSPQDGGSGIQYIYSHWSDGGAQYHTITPDSNTTYTANFTKQHYLTMTAGSGGTVTPASGWRDSNQIVLIKALPNQGYIFKGWTGTGTGSYSGLLDSVYISMNSPITQTASFAPDTMIITASAGVNGTIIPSGNVKVVYNNNQSFIITPDPTYNISDVVVNGSSVGAVGSYTFSNVRSNHSIIASFTRTGYTITATSGLNGTITPSGPVSVEHGESRTFTMTPNANYRIDSVLVDGIYIGASPSYTFENVTSNHTIRATFVLKTLSVQIDTHPYNLLFIADGQTYTSPYTFYWASGSSHNIAIVDTQDLDVGIRFLWVNWSDGGAKQHTVVPIKDTIFTAYFRPQFFLTMNADTGGSISPANGWQDSSRVVSIFAYPNAGYKFDRWQGIGAGSYSDTSNPATITMHSPITETATFKRYQANITVQTNPSGLSIVVDDTLYTSPKTFSWQTGSTHMIAVVDTQSGGVGTRYVWSNWNDGGQKIHTVVPNSDTSFLATFTIQYFLTMNTNTGGSVTPQSGWFNRNQSVTITAIPDPNYSFNIWSGSGDGSYYGNNNPATVTMRAPITQTASFRQNPVNTTVQTNPSGRSFIFNWVTYTVQQTFSVNPGSEQLLNVASPQPDVLPDKQYVWKSWSDGGAQSHSIFPMSDSTFTANFATQYAITIVTTPIGGGTASPGGRNFYTVGDTVSVLATPSKGYAFIGWTGPVTSQSNPTIVIIDSPAVITANFAPAFEVTVSTTPLGRRITVDDSTYTSPKLFNWLPGSTHSIGTTSPQSDTIGIRHFWTGWSDSGDITHTVSITTDTSFRADYTTEYYLTMNSGSGGTINPPDGWYQKGDSVVITAIPDSGYFFNRWEGIGIGSYSGNNNPAKVFIDSPIFELAIFGRILLPPILTGIPDGATGVSTNQILQWYKYSGATSYTLQVSTDSTFTDVTQFIYNSSSIIDTFTQISQFANLKTYYWRVKASVGDDESKYSSVYNFTTITAAIVAVSPSRDWATGYTYQIQWSHTNLSGNINIKLSIDGGKTYTPIKVNIPNSGITTWTVPTIGIIQPADSCKLRIESFLNNAIYSESNIFAIVSGTLQTIVRLSTSIPFSNESYSSTEYKLFSLPGVVDTISVGAYPLGTQKIDWRLFADNGNPENYLVELSINSPLTTGKGYWFVKNGNFDIPVYDMVMPRLDSSAILSIPLQTGWNIIGNPFNKNITWQTVLEANGLPSSVQLYGYSGMYITSVYLEPFKGYYYFNETNLTNLKIPYPFGRDRLNTSTLAVKWKVQLSFESDINQDSENYIGIAPLAKAGMDYLDGRKPPLFLDQGFLYFSRPEWDGKYSRFNSDFRPALGEGQVWNFEVSNPRKSEGHLDFSGIENIPEEYQVLLINVLNNVPIDIRKRNSYLYETVSKTMQFKLIVGSEKFVQQEISNLIPESFELVQNFPNPFNNSTSISIKLPYESLLRLDVYDQIGKHIKTLLDARYPSGVHTVRWDATDNQAKPVASGVYFYRLMSDGKLLQTKKMIMIK